MEYDDLYDESPYISRDISKREGIMSTMRGTFFICVTILVSVFGITFYGYQQDQFVVSSNNNYVAIFDRKSKTMNVCNGTNCTLITPHFPNLDSFPVATEKGSFLSRLFNFQGEKGEGGQRLLGSFPQSHQPPPVNPQAGQPQIAAGNPQISPQMMQQMQQQQMQQQQMQQQQMLQQQMQQQQMQQRGMMPQQAGAEETPEETETPTETADNTQVDEAASDEGDEEAAPV